MCKCICFLGINFLFLIEHRSDSLVSRDIWPQYKTWGWLKSYSDGNLQSGPNYKVGCGPSMSSWGLQCSSQVSLSNSWMLSVKARRFFTHFGPKLGGSLKWNCCTSNFVCGHVIHEKICVFAVVYHFKGEKVSPLRLIIIFWLK